MRGIKYTVTGKYKCGHSFSFQEGGNSQYRDHCAYIRSQNDCPECDTLKGGGEAIDLDGETITIPALCGGTERQRAWAVKIRKNVINGLLKYRRPGENPLLWFSKPAFQLSKWWIDHRDDNLAALVAEFKKAA